jgi:hypothetical protein
MSEIAYDTETCLIREGLSTPPLVCISTFCGREAELFATSDCPRVARRLLRGVTWGHNLAYDHTVLFAWTDCTDDLMLNLEEGRSYCTWVMERVIEISTGEPRKNLSMDVLGKKYKLDTPPKEDGTRLSYGPLWGKPLSAYTPEQIYYAKQDAIVTWQLRTRQLRYLEREVFRLEDVANLTRRQFLFQLVRNYGLRTDASKIDTLERACLEELSRMEAWAKVPFALVPSEEAEIARLTRALETADPRAFKTPAAYNRQISRWSRELDAFRLVRNCGTQNRTRLQQLVEVAYEGAPPLTEEPKGRAKQQGERRAKILEQLANSPDEKTTRKLQRQLDRMGDFEPQISTSSSTLKESSHPDLENFAVYGEWRAVNNKDIPLLRSGSKYPISPRFGLADSTRSTQSAPNLQNIRRKEGIREAFVPRPGFCFLNSDHSSLELVCVAQVIVTELGLWNLADLLNSEDYRGTGEAGDAHCLVASEIVGRPYEEVFKGYHEGGLYFDERQAGKVANYGKFGGMGNPDTFQRYAKFSYGVIVTDPVAVLGAWDRAMPDGVAFLRMVGNLPQEKRRQYNVRIPGTQIIRRFTPFCAAANTHFQGLGAQVETLVGWEILRATMRKGGPLWGCRIVQFIHDEWMLECPIGRQTEAAAELVRIMREAPRRLLPDVKLDASISCSSHWSKNATGKIHNGELLIWDGKIDKKQSWYLTPLGDRIKL